MNMLKLSVLVGSVTMLAATGPLYGQVSQRTAVIKVSPEVMKELATWDTKWRFFTPAANPLSVLADVVTNNFDIGGQGLDGGSRISRFLALAGVPVQETVSVGPGVSEIRYKVKVRGIGNGLFNKLFIDNPNLRLFLAYINNEEEEKDITGPGGGIKLVFQEEAGK